MGSRKIGIINAYRPCHTTANGQGPSTFVRQLETIGIRDGTSTDNLKKQFDEDIIETLKKETQDGAAMILTIDANDKASISTNLYRRLHIEGMQDIFEHCEDNESTSTRSKNRIDWTLCDTELTPIVGNARVLPDDIGAISDHSAIIIDLNL